MAARVGSTGRNRTRKVAGGRTLVLEEKAYEDGELIERALDYFAQRSDGTVFYFGEDVDNYVDGKIDNHDGSWLAGKDGAVQGIIMPAAPFVGQAYPQEFAPGIAEDKAVVLALNESVSTPAGDFTGCLKTEDTNPLDVPPLIEFKFYCPNVGVVREDAPDGFIELTSYTTAEGGGEIAASEQIDDGGDPVSQPAVAAIAAEDGHPDNAGPAVLGAGQEPPPQPAITSNAVPAGSGGNASSAHIDDGAELLPQAAITIEQAIGAAQSAAAGPVGEIDLEHYQGKLVFNVDIGDKDVKVHAQTGAVLSVDSDD